MRTRFPLVVLTLLFVAVSCDRAPTAPDDSAALAPSALLDADGNNGAVHWIPDPNCAVIDGYGEFYLVDCRNEIATYSATGTAHVVVQADDVPNPTGMLLQWDAYHPPQAYLDAFGLEEPPAPCYVLGPNGEALFTLKWKASLTPSGHATVTCHYAAMWEYEWPD